MTNRSDLLGKNKNLKLNILTAIFLYIGLISSCVHAPAPYRPAHWVNSPIDLKSIADNPNQSLLQVIIVYGPAWCHHSALRLVCPDRPVLFWDPGGAYGISSPEEVRSKDLIKIDPPDLETYLQFTWKHSSQEVEVFEWDLALDHAHELYDILFWGTDKNHPLGRFSTTTIGGFCSVSLSDFLHRFAKKRITVPKSYFLPHNLARVLYTQSPNRVLVLRRSGVQVINVPR